MSREFGCDVPVLSFDLLAYSFVSRDVVVTVPVARDAGIYPPLYLIDILGQLASEGLECKC